MPGSLDLTGRRRVETVYQSETTECGLACLAMIAGYHGRHENLVDLRHRFDACARGLRLDSLIRCAAELGLSARALRCEPGELDQLGLPAILHWDLNHYVVLEAVSRKGMKIHDPASAERLISREEMGNHFTGVALELVPADDFKATGPHRRPRLAYWFSGLPGLIPALAQVLMLSIMLQGAALAAPFYLQIVVDDVLARHDMDLLSLLGFGFLGLTLFSLIAQGLRGWAGIYLTNQLSYFMGARLYAHLLSLPVDYFQRRHMGDLVSRFSSLRPVQEFLTTSTIAVLVDGLMGLTTLCMMVIYAPGLAAVAILSLLTYLLLQLCLYLPAKRRHQQSITADARADSGFMESLRAIGPIKRFGIESARVGLWQNRFAETINARVRVGRLSLKLELLDASFSGITGVLLTYLGARQVLAGEMSVGMFYAFLAYRSHMTTAATSLAGHFMQYLMLSLHLERLADIQLAAPETTRRHPLRGLTGTLGLRQGTFRYSRNDPPIFRCLSFCLKPGEVLAIIGPSGCGKSTLLRALQGLLPLSDGELLINGMPLTTVGLSSFRTGSSSVMQGDDLLSGSLIDNIAFGDIRPSIQRIHHVATLACIHDEINRLPLGYESMVGEMGSSLSAGQVQRLLIARALYRGPRLLFLDEGTSHLDRKTEETVMRNILAQDITCIFVTHNKALVRLADKVLLLKDGRYTMRRLRARTCS